MDALGGPRDDCGTLKDPVREQCVWIRGYDGNTVKGNVILGYPESIRDIGHGNGMKFWGSSHTRTRNTEAMR